MRISKVGINIVLVGRLMKEGEVSVNKVAGRSRWRGMTAAVTWSSSREAGVVGGNDSMVERWQQWRQRAIGGGSRALKL